MSEIQPEGLSPRAGAHRGSSSKSASRRDRDTHSEHRDRRSHSDREHREHRDRDSRSSRHRTHERQRSSSPHRSRHGRDETAASSSRSKTSRDDDDHHRRRRDEKHRSSQREDAHRSHRHSSSRRHHDRSETTSHRRTSRSPARPLSPPRQSGAPAAAPAANISASASIRPDEADAQSDDDQDDDAPNFAPSGLLAAESNMLNGVALKYHEPPEARKPKTRWRLYCFKDGKEQQVLHLGSQSAYLLGRDRTVVDIPLDHESCSKQHAVVQYRQTITTNEFGDKKKRIQPFLIDLESSNGSYVNNSEIPTSRYYQLRSGDTLTFGASTREYVLLDESAT